MQKYEVLTELKWQKSSLFWRDGKLMLEKANTSLRFCFFADVYIKWDDFSVYLFT